MAEDLNDRRLRYFGQHDYGTYFQVEQASRLIDAFDMSRTDFLVDDVIEFHHMALFAENALFPKWSSSVERARRIAKIADLRRVIGTFFAGITNGNFNARITDVYYQYRADVLDLLGRNRVFERCTGSIVLEGLERAGFQCGDLLENKSLVRTYDEEARTIILARPRNAEQIIAKHLRSDLRHPIYLPASLTSADSQRLLDAYLDDEEANLNSVQLIATARIDMSIGIDAKLKLKAKRRYDEHIETFFATNSGMRSGCEVSFSEDQVEEAVSSLDGLVGKYSYSLAWLTDHTDFPTVLNNFIYLFEFADAHILLELPSYPADLGAIERLLATSGKGNYIVGAAFRLKDQASLLQTMMYEGFLRTQGVEIEAVVAWFFTDYLDGEFGAHNLKFTSSSPMATYLEKSRHLFSEMESVLKQFSLYVENHELDLDLLVMSSVPMTYKQIPSLVDGKYAYVTDDPIIRSIQHLLFSDQSGLTYINEELNASDFSSLIIANLVHYEDFADYQRGDLDALLSHGIVNSADGRIQFASPPQFWVLRSLWDHDAVSYYHHEPAGQGAIDTMIKKGWLERHGSLLTAAEASYFNYFLNQVEFSDGPHLRNRYLHGSQMHGEDRVHFQTYITVVRLIIAVVIKINDDFSLFSAQGKKDA